MGKHTSCTILLEYKRGLQQVYFPSICVTYTTTDLAYFGNLKSSALFISSFYNPHRRMKALVLRSELPLSSSTWSNEQEIRHYHHNSFESYPILLLDFSSNLDEVQYQTNHNRPPKLPVSKRQLGYPQQPQVVCNSTLEKKAKVSCWRTATTTKSCGNTTVRGSSKKQPHHDFSENF